MEGRRNCLPLLPEAAGPAGPALPGRSGLLPLLPSAPSLPLQSAQGSPSPRRGCSFPCRGGPGGAASPVPEREAAGAAGAAGRAGAAGAAGRAGAAGGRRGSAGRGSAGRARPGTRPGPARPIQGRRMRRGRGRGAGAAGRPFIDESSGPRVPPVLRGGCSAPGTAHPRWVTQGCHALRSRGHPRVTLPGHAGRGSRGAPWSSAGCGGAGPCWRTRGPWGSIEGLESVHGLHHGWPLLMLPRKGNSGQKNQVAPQRASKKVAWSREQLGNCPIPKQGSRAWRNRDGDPLPFT